MDVSCFDFFLPKERIAQEPVSPRDACRLMVLDCEREAWEHRRFFEIEEYLFPGDVLVVNESKVLKARLFLRKKTGGRVEMLFHRGYGKRWEVLLRPSSRVRVGQELLVEKNPEYRFLVQDKLGDVWFLEPLFEVEENFFDRFGEVPLPPYIHEKKASLEDYQTVYAKKEGSVASPTAGLHFTPELLLRLQKKGIKVLSVVLHVGLGTFQPVKVEMVERHRMHREWFSIGKEEAEAIMEARKRGQRVVAVGTTVTRVLETVWQKFGTLKEDVGETDLFIYPGFHFKVTDALITNFHLPRSTLFMLVCAFGGVDFIKRAYAEAIKENYRFYSFGDAMFLYGKKE
ncbi:MAG: tRNA preQ1(34) S-adenosylmethionine ribosyltransferase-isomerase QueA [Candidatus Caldatribacteriaceae bacterium]